MLENYVAIAQAIKDQAPGILWFDLDKGQVENPENFNSLIVPAVLIGTSEVDWKNLRGLSQEGDGKITVKLVLRLSHQTHLTDPLLLANLKDIELANEINLAVSQVPGVVGRRHSNDYPAGMFYVVEQIYDCSFKFGPNLKAVPVTAKINPFLHNPSVA
ncbi:hypothetical protein DYU11_18365 [Fibrisoma montanum]|uniref:Uncharacterized protein n=1 Tax=Fibrisoma montanum TaxID=2305895 RepID=A0A418M6B4_9BACT|nr:hypothetical protein [Fibrisoma montanum]RIV21371.1 hypothetical protein DYU11_18365 [Fibrisoma montanum]